MMVFIYPHIFFNYFQYYNLWISLIGGILCLIVMFLIDWITALITFIVTIALYLFVSYRNPSESLVTLFVGEINILWLLFILSLLLKMLVQGKLIERAFVNPFLTLGGMWGEFIVSNNACGQGNFPLHCQVPLTTSEISFYISRRLFTILYKNNFIHTYSSL